MRKSRSSEMAPPLPPGLPIVFPGTVVIDSAEQRPFVFSSLRADAKDDGAAIVVPIVRGNLRSGDYSLEGYESQIAIERKSLPDLFGTLGKGRKKFQRYHLGPMAYGGYEYAAVVCEADWRMICESPPPFTKIRPKTIYRTVISWQFRYPGIHWWFCPGREFAEKTTFRLLEWFWKLKQSQKGLRP